MKRCLAIIATMTLLGCRGADADDASRTKDATTSIALPFARKVDALAKVREHIRTYTTLRDVDLMGEGGTVSSAKEIATLALSLEQGWKALDEIIDAAGRSGATAIQSELIASFDTQRAYLAQLSTVEGTLSERVDVMEKTLAAIPVITYDLSFFQPQYEQLRQASTNMLAALKAIRDRAHDMRDRNERMMPRLFDIARTRAKGVLMASTFSNVAATVAALDEALAAEIALSPLLIPLRDEKAALEAATSAREPFKILRRSASAEESCRRAESAVIGSGFSDRVKADYLAGVRSVCGAIRSAIEGVRALSEPQQKSMSAIGHTYRSRRYLEMCQGDQVPALRCASVAWLSTLGASAIESMPLEEVKVLESQWEAIEREAGLAH